MQSVIRFVGIVNASVWFGAAVFFTVAAGPAFFSTEMASFLPRPYAARAAEVIIERLFVLQQWCGAIALLHLLVEYLYSGRQIERLVLAVVATMFVLSLVGGYWLLPKMHALQQVRYSQATSPTQRATAESTWGALHGVSWAVNLAVLTGQLYYLWIVTRPPQSLRFTGRANQA